MTVVVLVIGMIIVAGLLTNGKILTAILAFFATLFASNFLNDKYGQGERQLMDVLGTVACVGIIMFWLRELFVYLFS